MKHRNEHGNRLYLALGWFFAFASVFFLPFVFGPLGIIMGLIANRKGMHGNILILFSTFFAVLGLLVGKMMVVFFQSYLEVMTNIY